MAFVLYAVPFFFLLIGLELLADRWRGMRTYRLADALNSLSAGVLSLAFVYAFVISPSVRARHTAKLQME